ncbi:hypothetical protein SDC9_195969 [bioreactor metagenome]|uniref:Glycosyl transferase family 1 domain-containing protein n=1 Tax=bioreactor metagenome TaxID=1076179 RepID=A0A645IC00_9ZZZZ
MPKGTVLYIGSFEMPDKSAAAHRVLNNGKIFRDLGYKVAFIGPDKELKRQNFDIIKQRYEYSGMDIWCVPYPKSSKQWINYLSKIDVLKRFVNTMAM